MPKKEIHFLFLSFFLSFFLPSFLPSFLSLFLSGAGFGTQDLSGPHTSVSLVSVIADMRHHAWIDC
jgi:hypothetical protein